MSTQYSVYEDFMNGSIYGRQMLCFHTMCGYFLTLSRFGSLYHNHNHYGDESRHHYHYYNIIMSTPKYFTTAAGDK